MQRTGALNAIKLSALALAASMCAQTIVAGAVAAQELRGTVVQSDNTPASGVVVLLMHPTTDSVYARIVTSERGLFTVKAPAPGTVRLRLLRIGYQPTLDGPHTLAAGEVKTIRVTLGEKRVVMVTMDVRSDSKCNVRPDSALLVAKLYEEARKALIASASPISSVKNAATFTLYERSQDDRGKLVAPVNRSAFSGPSFRPFASLSADSLARVGYVVEEGDDVSYRAPDADVLLANSFLSAHCLQFVQGTGDRAASVGIGFRPSDRKSGMIDIKGTLWLDRETNELQTLEYSYDGLPDTYQKMNVGGRVDYTQLAAGLWFVNKWAIRMPRLVPRTNAVLNGTRGQSSTVVDIAGLVVTGGEVQSIKMDDDFLYTNPGAALAGMEPRDLRDFSSTGGQFITMSEAQAVTPVTELKVSGAIDSVFSSSSCTDATTKEYAGQVQGRIRSYNSQRVDSLPVVAEWKEDFKIAGQRDLTWQFRRLEARSKSNGSYVLCGLPLNRVVTLSALNGARKSRVGSVKVTASDPRATMDLAIGDLVGSVATTADLQGRGVLLQITDVNGKPLPYASVSINSGTARVADDEGRLIVNAAPRDSMSVLARRIGYQPFQGKIARDSLNTFRLTLVPNAQTLATQYVRAQGQKTALELTGFYDRVRETQRGAGSGYFFPPEELNSAGAAQLYQFLQARTPVTVDNNARSHVLLGRVRMEKKCPMAVIVDGIVQRGLIEDAFRENTLVWDTLGVTDPKQRMNAGGERDKGKLDISELVNMSQVMAIEVYMSLASAPSSISSRVPDSGCGVVVIWTGAR